MSKVRLLPLTQSPCHLAARFEVKSLKFATEAAITILRIDDMIKMDKEQKGPGGRGDY